MLQHRCHQHHLLFGFDQPPSPPCLFYDPPLSWSCAHLPPSHSHADSLAPGAINRLLAHRLSCLQWQPSHTEWHAAVTKAMQDLFLQEGYFGQRKALIVGLACLMGDLFPHPPASKQRSGSDLCYQCSSWCLHLLW